MAYVSGFDHDLFISYALVDDAKRSGVETGWVTAFVKTLDISLSTAIGRLGRLERWWDRTQLSENVPLDKQIQQALERTACLVVILSPGFFESPWCPKELEAFRGAIAKQARADSRIFVVDLGSVTEQQRRQEFANYKPFDFWKADDKRRRRPMGFPEPNSKDHPEFYDAVQDLADKLKEELDHIKSAGLSSTTSVGTGTSIAPVIPTPTPPSGPAIYVAETSDDLTPARKQLVTFLESHQFRVVCGGRNATDVEAWRIAASRDLAEATCFVQLLGLYPGREFDGATGSIVRLQYELAASMGKKVLQWRAPDLLTMSFDDPAHREFVTGVGVMECPLEEFKAEVKQVASPPPPSKPVDRPIVDAGQMPMIFINAGAEDRPQAQALADALAGMDCFSPLRLTDGDPSALREDFEANVLECDGLILFYGRIPPQWVRQQLMFLRRLLPKREKLDPPRPLRAVAICKGPPPNKPDISLSWPGLKWIDSSTGVQPEQLRDWLLSLRTGGAV